MKIFKSNPKHNLVVFIDPSEEKFDISMKFGNMIFNRFCIDEDAAFELSEVNHVKKSSTYIAHRDDVVYKLERKEQETEYSF